MYELEKGRNQKNKSKLQILAPDSSISLDHMFLFLIIVFKVNCF